MFLHYFSYVLLFALYSTIVRTQTVQQNRTISRLYGIYSIGPFIVNVNFGPQEALTIEADSVILPHVETFVRSPFVLVIRLANNLPDSLVNYEGAIRVYVTAHALTTLTNVGSGPITVTGPILSNDIQIEISGSGDVTAPLQVNNANIVLTGSGNFFTSGKAKNANINLSGSGSFYGKSLVTQQANIAVYASGNVELDCENGLTVWIAGSGSVQYGGNPTVNQQITGSGYITRAL